MEWDQVLLDPSLKDLPYKIELDEWGNIVMSPASNRHGRLQYRIGRMLEDHTQSENVQIECSIRTARNVKVADVAWGSNAFFSRNGLETPFLEAPEICVEVLSPGNSKLEIQEKSKLYFEAGAEEVWICNEDGAMDFLTATGELSTSSICPKFPKQIEIPSFND